MYFSAVKLRVFAGIRPLTVALVIDVLKLAGRDE
jgi:hypothetical protein